jgi:hypothetical protein
MVLVAMWGTVLLLIAGYIWFVVWRLRVERRKKEKEAASSPSMPMPMPTLAPEPERAPQPERAAAPERAPSEPSNVFLAASAAPVAPAAASVGPRTVVELLAGIKLPHDLAPITMMAPRPDVRDRIAFETEGVAGEVVGAAFGAELERLGYMLTPLDATLVAADRGGDQLRCKIHVDASLAEIGKNKAFPAVPDGAVVIEVWTVL